MIDKQLEELKELVREEDNEAVHYLYDKIVWELAYKQDKDLVEKIDKIVEGIDFWYA